MSPHLCMASSKRSCESCRVIGWEGTSRLTGDRQSEPGNPLSSDPPSSFRRHHLETQSPQSPALLFLESFLQSCDGQIRTKGARGTKGLVCWEHMLLLEPLMAQSMCWRKSFRAVHALKTLFPRCNMIHVCCLSVLWGCS